MSLQIIRCTINGQERELAVEPGTSLAEALRGLGLLSVKEGCQAGECGACTVLLDGQSIHSCIYLAVLANGKSILTLEGLKAPEGALHPLQQAFIKEAAAHCGFCNPGVILTGVEILEEGRSYSLAELRQRLSGHACTCGGQQNILHALASVLQAQGLLRER